VEHVAIDLGGGESQVCIRSEKGEVLFERKVSTSSLASLLKRRPNSRVVVETCAEAFHVADAARQLGHEVRVVPATLVRTLGVGARGVKTDERDARALSEVSTRIDLPSVHVPSQEARERKSLCGMRDGLVASRTMLINTVRGWMRGRMIKVRTGKTETFSARVVQSADKIELPAYVRRQLQSIEQLTGHILEADKELEALAKKDLTCPRLMTVPGVGPVTAIRFVAALDQITRFATVAQVQSYLGLTPGENSSSERKRRTGITKAGPPALRASLVQAAWAARRARGKHPMVLWSLEVEKRRGKHVAIVALARKLTAILFAIWRDGTLYSPNNQQPAHCTGTEYRPKNAPPAEAVMRA
jgi:transposase